MPSPFVYYMMPCTVEIAKGRALRKALALPMEATPAVA